MKILSQMVECGVKKSDGLGVEEENWNLLRTMELKLGRKISILGKY